jgi:hypothetical protein
MTIHWEVLGEHFLIDAFCCRKQIHEKIHFLDGQHRLLEFDSATTAEEVVKLVKQKIGMRTDARGWSIYEVFGELGRWHVRNYVRKWSKLSIWTTR